MVVYEQGDIIKVEGIKNKLLVVSNNTFNKNGQSMCCPLFSEDPKHPLHIIVTNLEHKKYTVKIESVKYIDISTRGFSHISHITYSDVINVSDALQALFEY